MPAVPGKRKRSPVGARGRTSVDRAVRDAEATTGLEFCVYLGPAEEEPRAHAERLFTEAGLVERPAVLLLVAPDRRAVEVVTAPDVRDRIPDEAAAMAIQEMTPLFRRGRYAAGIVVGLRRLAAVAGPGTDDDGDSIPNVIGDD